MNGWKALVMAGVAPSGLVFLWVVFCEARRGIAQRREVAKKSGGGAE